MLHWLAIFAASTTAAVMPRGVVVLPPRAPPLIGQPFNPNRPAFVPKFARVDNPPVGHFAEREWAYRYTFPAPVCYGGDYGGYGFGGYAYGGYGGFHNFDGHFVGTAGDAFR